MIVRRYRNAIARAAVAEHARWWALLLLLAFFLLTRLWLFLGAEPWDPTRKYTHFVHSDGAAYYWIAVNILEGNGYSSSEDEPFDPNSARTPLYPFFLAAVFLLFGLSIPWIVAVQMVVQLATVGIVYRFLVRLTSPLAAALVTLYCILDPVYLNSSGLLYTETLYYLLNVLFAFALLLCVERGFSTWRVVLLSAIFALGLLTRPIGLYFLPLILLAVVLRERRLRTVLAYAAIVLVCTFSIVFPWLLRNYLVFGTASMSSLQGAHIYYYWALPFVRAQKRGAAELGDGLHPVAEPGLENPFDRSAYFRDQALQVMKQHPVSYGLYHFSSSWRLFASASTKSLSELLGWRDITPLDTSAKNTTSSFRLRSPQARTVLALNGLLSGLLLTASGIGFAALLCRRRLALALMVFLPVLYYVAIIGPETSSRYRLSLLPYLLYSSGVGISALQTGRLRRPRGSDGPSSDSTRQATEVTFVNTQSEAPVLLANGGEHHNRQL